jgi:hypothetical protein
MGQEILYCFKCQSRVTSSDLGKGEAFRIDDSVACAACTKEILPTFPLKRQKEILNQSGRGAPPDTATRTPRRPTPTVPAPLRSNVPILVVAGGVALVLILVVVLASGKSAPVTPAPDAPAAPPQPSLLAEREKNAKGALELARAYAGDNPADFEGQIRLLQKVAFDWAGTSAASDARRDAEALNLKRRKAIAGELAALVEQTRPLLAAEEFQKSMDLLDGARKRHAQEDWGASIDAKIKEIRDTMAQLFPALRDGAVAAKKKANADKIQSAKVQVARWGVASYAQELDNALMAVAAPIQAKADTGVLHLRVAEAIAVGKKLKKVGEGDWSLTQSWGGIDEYVEWTAVSKSAGTYTVQMNYACPKEWAGEIYLSVGDEARTFKIEPTANWGEYKTITLGTIPVSAGSCRVVVRPAKLANAGSMSLRFVKLVPAK